MFSIGNNCCGKRHHTLLHLPPISSSQSDQSSSSQTPATPPSSNGAGSIDSTVIFSSLHHSQNHKSGVRLKVLPVMVFSGNDPGVMVYAFLDEEVLVVYVATGFSKSWEFVAHQNPVQYLPLMAQNCTLAIMFP